MPMRKNLSRELLTNLLPLFALIPIFLVTKNELIICVVLIAMMLVTFRIKYYRNELVLFLTGIILGIIIELGGDLVNKMQYWTQGSFFGIPLWLPIFWGLTFVYIRRIGNLIVKSK